MFTARFYSVTIQSSTETDSLGVQVLEALERNKIFSTKMKDSRSPLFIILRHTRSTQGVWDVGGILQVTATESDAHWGSIGCQMKLVSTAHVTDDKKVLINCDKDGQMVSHKARLYIQTLIKKFHEVPRTVSNLFLKPGYVNI